jgi:perosamine synthetase
MIEPAASSPRFIPVSAPTLTGREREFVLECLDSTWISSKGKHIAAFESSFAEFCGTRHAVATNNGTTALHLALVALGIGPGDEVIVPSLTYIASANAVTYCGAMPVLVDCDERTLNADPVEVRAKVTPRTRAIMAVHLYGHPVDMDPILELGEAHGIAIVEDAAEAHGAEYKGRRAGSLGTCAAFSFFGNKIVTTGEGGMVTTDDDALADRLRLYRGQGVSPERTYWHDVIGYNYRMTNVAAAIGRAQMERIDEALARRAELAGWYDETLVGLPLVRPIVESWARHAYWMYTVLLPQGSSEEQREHVRAELAKARIETRPVFYPMHLLPPYAEDPSGYPRATSAAARGINLPTHEQVSRADVGFIRDRLEDALATAGLR